MSDAKEAVIVEETGAGLFQVLVRTGVSTFLADEPEQVGGLSSGPDPFDLACAALGACSVMTMRLYARRKGWEIAGLSAEVRHSKASAGSIDRFEFLVHLPPGLEAEKRDRLLYIAGKCPVHQMLTRGAEVVTTVVTGDLGPPATDTLHGRMIEELCVSAEEER